MLKHVYFLISFVFSASAFACGIHQSTGFSLVTEEGSLDVFASVIDLRQSNELNNLEKPDHFRLYSFKSALQKPSDFTKLNFSLFEAIKGHYSDVYIGNTALVTGKMALPTEDELIVITELDILDGLANGSLSWEDALDRNLVRVNGPTEQVEQINLWFNDLFPASFGSGLVNSH
ncbi:hypothetical protein [Vibrio sp. 10N.261.51.F12]|uniref:hypothetical protein n=1 Tax=Vibrio sp. 10N.261.51.F12 TaxID=3229679 RepID=UPI0035546A72